MLAECPRCKNETEITLWNLRAQWDHLLSSECPQLPLESATPVLFTCPECRFLVPHDEISIKDDEFTFEYTISGQCTARAETIEDAEEELRTLSVFDLIEWGYDIDLHYLRPTNHESNTERRRITKEQLALDI